MKLSATIRFDDDFPEAGTIMSCTGGETGTLYKVKIDDSPKALGWHKENGVIKGVILEVQVTILETLRHGKPSLTLVEKK